MLSFDDVIMGFQPPDDSAIIRGYLVKIHRFEGKSSDLPPGIMTDNVTSSETVLSLYPGQYGTSVAAYNYESIGPYSDVTTVDLSAGKSLVLAAV